MLAVLEKKKNEQVVFILSSLFTHCCKEENKYSMTKTKNKNKKKSDASGLFQMHWLCLKLVNCNGQ